MNYSSSGGNKRHKAARKLMISEGTIIQMAGTRDERFQRGNDFSMNYSSSIRNKRLKGGGEEMTSI
jgi:hypothetical protein